MPGALHDMDFMVKDSKKFADSGGWGYAEFEYDPASQTFRPGDTNDSPPQEHDAKCGFACHTIVADKDYVFTAYPQRCSAVSPQICRADRFRRRTSKMSKYSEYEYRKQSGFDMNAFKGANQAIPMKTLVIHCFDPRAAEIPQAVAAYLGDEVYPGENILDKNAIELDPREQCLTRPTRVDAPPSLSSSWRPWTIYSTFRMSLWFTTRSAARRLSTPELLIERVPRA